MSDRRLEIGIVVRDLESTTAFYRDGLGLAHLEDVATPLGLLRRFTCGDGVLKLMRLDELPRTANPPGGITGRATGLRWFSVTVDDIDQALDRCVGAGGSVVWPVQTLDRGSKILVIEDPESNCWIEVVQPAPFRQHQ
jgi:predicted enzyme related to lactoylglutathione lyase